MTPIRTIIAMLLIILAGSAVRASAMPAPVLHPSSVDSDINRARRRHARPEPYGTTVHLTNTARDRAIAASGHTHAWFSLHIHDNMAARQLAHGVSKPDRAEIAAYGYTDPSVLVASYMSSTVHRAIILTSHAVLQSIGCGVAGEYTVCDFAGR